MKIDTNKYVSLMYDLHVGEDDERELMEQATEEMPLDFVFGTGSMLEKFEANLAQLQEGDRFEFSISPYDAYGEYDTDKVVDLPKNIFAGENGETVTDLLVEGAVLPMMDSDGNRLDGSIVEVKEDAVTMDFNHPFAGETLHFTGKVLAVREATAEEIEEALGGHSCGCGCDEHKKAQCGGCE